VNQSGDPYISKAFTEGKIDRKLRMLEGVARILSDNYNVSVVFSPDGECKTTESIMTLPYDKGVDEALILGLCGHETGHLKWTRFSIGRDIARHKKIHNRPLLYVVFNVMEDVRIEREMEKVYPGFKEMFTRLLEREKRMKELQDEGESIDKIDTILREEGEEEIERLRKALEEAGFSKEYIEFEIQQVRHAQEAPLCEIQKILDVTYLTLRDYDYTWYPPEIVDYVRKEVIDTAKEIYDCHTSDEALQVAIKVYNIITDNEKKHQSKENDEDGTDKQPTSSQDKGRGKGSKENKDKDKKDKGKDSESEGDEGSSEKDAEGSEGQKDTEEGEQEGSSDAVRIRPGQVLQVGSKVTHLKDPSKRGVVVFIDNKTRTIEVDWE
jgi:hypothetical protein